MAARKSPLDDVWVSVEPRRPGFYHLFFVCIGLMLFGWLYFHLAGILIRTTNQDPGASDQAHNIKRALVSRQYGGLNVADGTLAGWARWWPHDTDGVVAPLWSRVAGSLADASHKPSASGRISEQDRVLFERGKWFNVCFSFAFLSVLTLGAAWAFPAGTVGVLNLMILSGLGALLPRAVYFHPEPLYYAFFTGTWICCLRALLGNRWLPYVGAGIFAALAYLTKTAVQPLLIAFCAVSALRLVTGLFGFGRDERRPFHWFKCVGGIVLLWGVFLALVWPRLEFSQRVFGDRFHSYPAYWMWMDDFESCYEWMGKHPDRRTLGQLDPAEKPSPLHYWRHHTGDEIRDRAVSGWLQGMERGFFPREVRQSGRDAEKPWKHLLPQRGWLLLALTALVATAAALSMWKGEPVTAPTQRARQRATPGDRFFAVTFVLLACSGYSFAYGWYEAIGGGERFLLSLLVPMALSLLWAGESLAAQLPQRSGWRHACTAGHLLILLFLLVRVANLVAHPVFWEASRA